MPFALDDICYNEAGHITADTTRSMVAMADFYIVAVHEYQEMDMAVLHGIGEHRWKDMVADCAELGLSIRP